MLNRSSRNHEPEEEIVGEVFVVPRPSLGKRIIDSLRDGFTGDGRMRRGDFYTSRSLELFKMHLDIINIKETNVIMDMYTEATQSRRRMETTNSRAKRYFKAIQYKRLSKATYEIAVGASNRAIDDNLMHPIAEAPVNMGNSPTIFFNGSGDTVDVRNVGILTESMIFGPPSTSEFGESL